MMYWWVYLLVVVVVGLALGVHSAMRNPPMTERMDVPKEER